MRIQDIDDINIKTLLRKYKRQNISFYDAFVETSSNNPLINIKEELEWAKDNFYYVEESFNVQDTPAITHVFAYAFEMFLFEKLNKEFEYKENFIDIVAYVYNIYLTQNQKDLISKLNKDNTILELETIIGR